MQNTQQKGLILKSIFVIISTWSLQTISCCKFELDLLARESLDPQTNLVLHNNLRNILAANVTVSDLSQNCFTCESLDPQIKLCFYSIRKYMHAWWYPHTWCVHALLIPRHGHTHQPAIKLKRQVHFHIVNIVSDPKLITFTDCFYQWTYGRDSTQCVSNQRPLIKSYDHSENKLFYI